MLIAKTAFLKTYIYTSRNSKGVIKQLQEKFQEIFSYIESNQKVLISSSRFKRSRSVSTYSLSKSNKEQSQKKHYKTQQLAVTPQQGKKQQYSQKSTQRNDKPKTLIIKHQDNIKKQKKPMYSTLKQSPQRINKQKVNKIQTKIETSKISNKQKSQKNTQRPISQQVPYLPKTKEAKKKNLTPQPQQNNSKEQYFTRKVQNDKVNKSEIIGNLKTESPEPENKFSVHNSSHFQSQQVTNPIESDQLNNEFIEQDIEKEIKEEAAELFNNLLKMKSYINSEENIVKNEAEIENVNETSLWKLKQQRSMKESQKDIGMKQSQKRGKKNNKLKSVVNVVKSFVGKNNRKQKNVDDKVEKYKQRQSDPKERLSDPKDRLSNPKERISSSKEILSNPNERISYKNKKMEIEIEESLQIDENDRKSYRSTHEDKEEIIEEESKNELDNKNTNESVQKDKPANLISQKNKQINQSRKKQEEQQKIKIQSNQKGSYLERLQMQKQPEKKQKLQVPQQPKMVNRHYQVNYEDDKPNRNQVQSNHVENPTFKIVLFDEKQQLLQEEGFITKEEYQNALLEYETLEEADFEEVRTRKQTSTRIQLKPNVDKQSDSMKNSGVLTDKIQVF